MSSGAPLEFTGERFTPECVREIWYEHWHRYALVQPWAQGRRVLDAACGEGYGSAILAQTAASVLGLASRRQRGSGVLWRPGVLVTSASTLWRLSTVSLVRPDGEQVPGEVRGVDGGTDLGAVSFDSGDLPVAARDAGPAPRVGDFVLAGGEIAAMALVEAAVRLIPGVLGDHASTAEESFASGLLEYPHYTRPQTFEGRTIPEVLSGGNHSEIAKFRLEMAQKLTKERRPDLWTLYEKPKA